MRIAIVGAGLFGCIIGQSLKEHGAKVALFDSNEEGRASRCSGCLMKPSWFNKMPNRENALALLDKLYGLQEIPFRLLKVKTMVYRVPRQKVLTPSAPKARARISNYKALLSSYDRVILCMGIWSPVPGLEGKTGISFEWEALQLKENVISPWAPFKQVVAFKVPEANLVWGGDGSAILEKNWTKDREQECLERVAKTIKVDFPPFYKKVGVRPYIDSGKDPCYVKEISKHIWVATGGAKLGTISAAWAALRLLDAL